MSLFNLLFGSRNRASGASKPQTPELPHLDSSLYPLTLTSLANLKPSQPSTQSNAQNEVNHHSFDSAYQLLLTLCPLLQSSSHSEFDNQLDNELMLSMTQDFSQQLQHNSVYQDWINFTVFGSYVQRSFSAFYRQSEDVFNADMPDILRHELMRHTQRLPAEQVLLCAGQIPSSVRQEQLLLTTLNPLHAMASACDLADFYPASAGFDVSKKSQTFASHSLKQSGSLNKSTATSDIILNVIATTSDKVKAFAIKHNKRTRERLRHEVMILDFAYLILVKEERVAPKQEQAGTEVDNQSVDSRLADKAQADTQSEKGVLIRHYKIG
ncbi:hypothetical protein [Psychrobacter sp. FDAARGOS_221]|uniref:hypothetical protein n=1 Tax=Psychrobacter sp. FDAARGOS_221 TaxID=1975705 RepID=UPI000BB5907A|nr:hypothetical protein [Psychrobacter sp. FDAARGOS_221]PNK60887.1 hypothetical protein A6J60_008330 [Psychrobacter sp. FDAARGOS_221]